jgi:hypothetical protein
VARAGPSPQNTKPSQRRLSPAPRRRGGPRSPWSPTPSFCRGGGCHRRIQTGSRTGGPRTQTLPERGPRRDAHPPADLGRERGLLGRHVVRGHLAGERDLEEEVHTARQGRAGEPGEEADASVGEGRRRRYDRCGGRHWV